MARKTFTSRNRAFAALVRGRENIIVTNTVDSAGAVENIVDSAYIAARSIAGTDSASVISLITNNSTTVTSIDSFGALALIDSVAEADFAYNNITHDVYFATSLNPSLTVSHSLVFSGDERIVSSGARVTPFQTITVTKTSRTGNLRIYGAVHSVAALNATFPNSTAGYFSAYQPNISIRVPGESSNRTINALIVAQTTGTFVDNGDTTWTAPFEIKGVLAISGTDISNPTNIANTFYAWTSGLSDTNYSFNHSNTVYGLFPINASSVDYPIWTRVDQDSGFVASIIDSAYVSARAGGGGGGVDSATVISLIDSSYVQARQLSVDAGLDSAQVLAIAGDAGLDSAAVLSIALSGYGERKTFIQSSAPTVGFQAGDFWWDRDGNTLYKGTASSSYSSYPLPAGSTSQYPGLALDSRGNHLTKQPGYTSASFTLSGAGSQSYSNTAVFATHGGTYPWEPFDASNTGVKYTLTTPTTFYAFYNANTDSGWIYKIEYEDGSYAISNNASPIAEPTSISWFDANGNSLNKTVAFGNGLRILTHPTGKKCSAFVVARGSYGTRNYDFWIFFSGADYWKPVGDMYLDSDGVRSYVTADHINSLGISAGLDSAAVTTLIDSAYINARVDPFDSSHVINLVDSAYIALRDRFQDSSGIIAIVDSNYVQARQSAGGGGVDSAATITLINSVIDSVGPSRAFTYTYTATANQTTFTGADNNSNTLAYSTGNIITFLNGILLIDSDDYAATTGSSIVLNSPASLNDILNVVKFRASGSGGNLSHEQYKYTVSSPTTTFSGNDDKGNSLSYETGELQVFLNGILLIDSQDYTASNGTSVVLTAATDSNDVLAISKYIGGGSGGGGGGSGDAFRATHFVYTTAAPTTTISGADDNSTTLSYIENQIQVFQNGILLIDSADYTATNGTSIVLGAATDSDDTVVITAFRGVISGGLDSAAVLAISGGGGGGGTDSATVIALSGELKGGMFRINPQSLSINTTIDSAENAHVAGPISFDSGVVLTINGNLVIS